MMDLRMGPALYKAMKERGNCFEVAFEFAFNNRGWLVCHGTPVFQGPEHFGERYKHAWNESENGLLVADCSLGEVKIILRRDYYAAGKMDEGHVARYTLEQAVNQALENEHYGSWKDWEGVTL